MLTEPQRFIAALNFLFWAFALIAGYTLLMLVSFGGVP
jgi:hypothetical protein